MPYLTPGRKKKAKLYTQSLIASSTIISTLSLRMILNSSLTLNDEYYATFNKQLNIYATRGEKSIQVKRFDYANASDNDKTSNQVSSIFIRDLNQIVKYDWDIITGKYLTIFFKDGSIRINDMLQNGKLVAFLRTKLNDTDYGIWDRIIIGNDQFDENESLSFNYNILSLLPQLVKYDPRDELPNMSLYVPQVPIWRHYKEKIIDIHLLHQSRSDNFVLVLNGEYIINLSNSNANNKICKILKETKGLYRCFYENGFIKEIDIRNIFNNNNNNEKGKLLTLIQQSSLMKDYFKFLKNHINIMKKDLVTPFLNFTHKLKDQEIHNFDIYEHLVVLFFDGILSDELSEWLKYSLSDKNLEMLQKEISKAYQTTTQILMMCIIPVLERLIILANQLQSLLLSLQLFDQETVPDLKDISIPETKGIIEKCQNVLRNTIIRIKTIIHENSLLKILVAWLDDKRKSVIDEEHLDDLDINSDSSYGFQIMDGLDIIFGRDTKYDILNSITFLEVIKSCEDQLQKVDESFVVKGLTNGVEIGSFIPFLNQIYEPKSITLLDMNISELEGNKIIVYVIKILDKNNNKMKLGVIDYKDHRVKVDVTIPCSNIEDVTGVHIVENTSIEEGKDKNGNNNDNIIFDNKIRIITQFHRSDYETHICHISLEPLSPTKIDVASSKHDKPLIAYVSSLRLSFSDDIL